MLVLSKKDKTDQLLMESRKLLLNQVEVGSDGRLIAVDEIRTFRYGAAEGEHKVRISGITTRDFFYRTKYNRTKAVYQASEAMKDIGRRASLKCMNDAAACIIKSPIFYPVVIVFYENRDGRMQLSAFTARAFSSLFAINSALKRFDRELPDTMVRKVSIHSVHDVNMAVIHSLKGLVKKDSDNEDGDYVDLKKMFKAERRNRKVSGAGGRGGRGRKKSEESVRTGNYHIGDDKELLDQRSLYNGESESLSSEPEGLEQEDSGINSDRSYESREERKARKKAERLEKKREAARRKYEKLLEEAPAKTPGGEDLINTSVDDGYSEEEDEDIMREFTGMSTDELDAYDDNETDEDIMREFTGMSTDEMNAYGDYGTNEDN